jgi:hypothetical protein
MDEFKLSLANYFVEERNEDRNKVLKWSSLIIYAKNMFKNSKDFDDRFEDLCDFVQSKLFSDEECSLAFSKHTIVLSKVQENKRRAMQKRFNNARKRILDIKKKISDELVPLEDVTLSNDLSSECNSEDEFIDAADSFITPSNCRADIAPDLELQKKAQNATDETQMQLDAYVNSLIGDQFTPQRASVTVTINDDNISSVNSKQAKQTDDSDDEEHQPHEDSSPASDESYEPNDDDADENHKRKAASKNRLSVDDNSDDDSENQKSKKKSKKRSLELEENCALLSSQRLDTSMESATSLAIKPLKFYIHLLSDNEPYVKCGFSSMDDTKVANQYARDRVPSSAIFVHLKHTGPGVNLLFDSLLKYRLRPFLYHMPPNENDSNYSALRVQFIESVKALNNCYVVVAETNVYNAEKHELYMKEKLTDILEAMTVIAEYSLQELKKEAFEVEALKNTRLCRSRFMTKKFKARAYPF